MQLGLPFDSEHDARAPLQAPTAAPPSSVQFYFVRHRRARRYVLRVENDGRARITIPRGGSRKEATAFGLRHLAWITTERARVEESPFSVIERRTLRARADVELPARLRELAARHGLEVSRISVRDQRARWGSCGRDGHICVNWRLVLMPSWVRDYVLIHELMHLRRMDHSRVYWKLVAHAYPGYEAARRWLREHGPSLR